ncbi:MAG: N-6 DNA methylase [Acetobacter sp.]|nr:N-6 DNA methylase [Acetobacter sp.]
MATLLNQKLLKSCIEKFHFPENEKRQKSEKIISAWQKSFKESDLSKAKETSLQGKFFAKFFCEILGYTTQDDGNEVWTLKQEAKTEVDGKEADGSLGFYSKTSKKTRCVIELKDAQQPLDKKQLTRESKQTPVEQAFQYLYKFDGCDWVIVSNFRYTRLYHKSKGQTAYEEFDILTLHEEKEFKRFYYCLCQENLLNEQARSPMDELVKRSGEACIDITKEFYLEFKNVRRKLFDHIVENNPDFDKKLLLEKTQKILDRFVFIFFCEDTAGLLPHNTVENTYELGQASFSSSECKIWEQFRGLFVAIDKGNTRVKPPINAYNGGLFADDEILDKQLIIRDEIFEDIKNLARYDFESDLNVNILGHIFEQSLSDLEQIKNELDGIQEEKKNAKRKKDGIFYTPEYITHYIVKETIGKYLEENPEKLEEIKILDPACGSGAFLNQAHSFLVQQRKIQRDEKIAQLGKSQLNFFEHINYADIDRSILLNNLYGVDLNKESVEITKLALWLKTAHAQCKLNNLDENIKCGNSLIDDETIAGDKAFKWEEEFPSLFKEKELKAYHITFITYGSYEGDDVKNSSKNKYEKPDLSLEDEEFILNALIDVIEESELRVLALNICKNHVHKAVVCAYDEIEKYVQKIKSMTSRQLNIHKGITIPNKEKTLSQEKQKAKTQNRLWASKYDVSEIQTEEELLNVINYIHHNRQKHNLPALQQDVQHRVMTLCWEINKAFVPYEKGGFDCIIGNPPYIKEYTNKSTFDGLHASPYYQGKMDIWTLFACQAIDKLTDNGYLSFIAPNSWLTNAGASIFRNKILSDGEIVKFIDFGDFKVFKDAGIQTMIFIFKKCTPRENYEVDYCKIEDKNLSEDIIRGFIENDLQESITGITKFKATIRPKDLKDKAIAFLDNNIDVVINKIQNSQEITYLLPNEMTNGIHSHHDRLTNSMLAILGNNHIVGEGVFCLSEKEKRDLLLTDKELEDLIKPYYSPKELFRYYGNSKNSEWIIYTNSKFKDINEIEQYPNIKTHLDRYANIITSDNRPYGLHRSRNENFFKGEKIISLRKCANPTFSYTFFDCYVSAMYYVIKTNRFNMKYLTGLLNSNLIKFWLKNQGKMQGDIFQIDKEPLLKIPLIVADKDKQEYIGNLVLRLIEHIKTLKNNVETCLEVIKSLCSIDVIPNKFNEFYKMGINPFIEELDKLGVMTRSAEPAGKTSWAKPTEKSQSKSQLRDTTRGSKLTLSQKEELISWYKTKSEQLNKIKSEIDTLDREIDQEVYKLYNLTPEEIKIIEGGS